MAETQRSKCDRCGAMREGIETYLVHNSMGMRCVRRAEKLGE